MGTHAGIPNSGNRDLSDLDIEALQTMMEKGVAREVLVMIHNWPALILNMDTIARFMDNLRGITFQDSHTVQFHCGCSSFIQGPGAMQGRCTPYQQHSFGLHISEARTAG